MELHFQVEGKPQAKQRPRFSRGRTYTPKATKDYERKVAQACALAVLAGKDAPDWPLDARYSISMDIYFPDKRRRDLDNVEKSICDGLNGVAWNDDCQIDHVVKWRKLDREEPRVEIVIRVLNDANA